jgi:hypothetical protein
MNAMPSRLLLTSLAVFWCGPLAFAQTALAQTADDNGSRIQAVPAAVRASPGFDRSVRLCLFKAYLNDRDPTGTNLRAAPGGKAAILKKVPNSRAEAGQRIAPELEVIGSKDGWFLVRNIHWEGYGDGVAALIFKGPAWVSATLVSAEMEGTGLRQRPEPDSPLITPPASASMADKRLRRMHGCSGSLVDATFDLADRTQIRGWSHGACANQVTTCGGGHRVLFEKDGKLVER